MKSIATGMAVLVLCVSAAPGGPLKTEQVAGDARWVAHLDVDAVLSSGIAQFVLDEAAKKEEFHAGLAKIEETLGFRPLKDMHGLTLYGREYTKESGVAVIDVAADRDKLLALLLANEEYKKTEYGDHALHQWTDPPRYDEAGELTREARGQVGCFYDEGTIVIAPSVKVLQGALDVLDGKAENLAKTKALKMLPAPAKGAFLVAAAEDIELPAEKHPRAALLRKITDGAVQAGESDGSVFADVSVLARTVEEAARIRQVVQGFVALAQMQLQALADEDMPVLGEKITVTGDGKAVRLAATIPTKSLIKAVQFMAARAEAMKARRAKLQEFRAGAREAKQPSE